MATQDGTFSEAPTGNPYLDSLIWGAKWNGSPITYYFGEGNAIDDLGNPFFGYEWFGYEIQAFERAIALYESVCMIDFQPAASLATADIGWWSVDGNYLGSTLALHLVPDEAVPDPIYGYFSWQHPSWTEVNLQQGGYGFVTIIHELGHALGLAHPHDGGGSLVSNPQVFPGVDNRGDVGDFGLNQGIWTTMSYIRGWRAVPLNSYAYGSQGTPMAFDIAALQAIYGANMNYNSGGNFYTLPGGNGAGAFWSCIWDAGGIDWIRAAFSGSSCIIDLNDAPLVGPDAGGYVSRMAGVRGGFTIANGVVIENATGYIGNDRLIGNEVANVLVGDLGNDTLIGGAGADSLIGGRGNDVYIVDDLGDLPTEDDSGKLGGVDLVQSNISLLLGKNIENLTLTGVDNIEGIGNELANFLTGNSANNTLDGGLGADKVMGGAGDDFYKIESAADVVVETTAGFVGGDDTVESKISFTLGANLERLILTGVGDLAGTGNALANELQGNSENNGLKGLAGGDSILGGDGNDTLDGGTGADSMKGGDDDDLYVQDNKLDIIDETGSSLNDELRTNQVLATLIGGIEHYTFTGGKSVNFAGDGQNNRLAGTKVADTLIGDGGDDTLIGGAGADSLSGGDGDDVYGIDSSADKIADSGGKDRVESAIAYVLGAGLENLTLIGKAATGTGNLLDNQITGNLYGNKLDGAGGTDILTGGDGSDTYYIDVIGDDVVETNGTAKGGVDLIVSMVDYALGLNEENLTLDAKGTAALATGNELNNILIGNGLNNALEGGVGIDKMAGGGGNDTYKVDSKGELVTETLAGTAGGTDTVESKVSFVLGANLEHLMLLDSDNVDGTGNGLDNIILGNDGNNKLSGLAGADILTGNGGNDTLDGGSGVDKMTGGSGGDVYVQDNAADLIEESGADANDELRANQALFGIVPGIEHYSFLGAAALNFTADGEANRVSGTKAGDKIDGGGGNDTLSGNGGNDTLTGGIGSDSLDGGAGNDSLIGGDGNDVYVINSASDKISDSDGDDTVQSFVTFTLASGLEDLQLLGAAAVNGTGNGGANLITGNAAANKLAGGDGADTLDGGVGNDIITGGGGADSIDVSKGNDRLLYTDALDAGDTITGFDGNATGGQDQVNLDLLLDKLGIAAKDRATRVSIVDGGGSVEISVDTDNDIGNGFELLVVTLNTADDITIGADVVLGS